MTGKPRCKGEVSSPCFQTAACRKDWLGFYVIALAGTKVVGLSFSESSHHQACRRLRQLFPNAVFSRSRSLQEDLLRAAQGYLDSNGRNFDVVMSPLLLQAGTAFQQRVWQGISAIAPGQTKTYGELAAELGNPGYARAVGRACNDNPLALLIPCHRVVGSSGLGGFAGGLSLKGKLLRLETGDRA